MWTTTRDYDIPTIAVDPCDNQTTSSDTTVYEILFFMAGGGSYEQLSNDDFSFVTTTDQDYSIATISNCDVPKSDVGPYGNQTTSCHAEVPAFICPDADDGLFEQSSHQDHHPLVTTTYQVYTALDCDVPMSDVGPYKKPDDLLYC